ncbi:Crp/Fnr family transcriptional regulator [Thermochromatium tepidum]|uniref:Cyclic nucleotide-binding domain-containing protein n=1 Tax=Thermochromatium tepidum ATCC 43061 TaxID=316276 RepID=A0A6I6EEY3_THETI|nr:cyclic nucleotide-binding domain-containing protein [Thermochromatium tepidum]QGU32750.1 cyclic nucleotide-binding domain-containing protein [Thermochromatium tepidum ATCC 43061]
MTDIDKAQALAGSSLGGELDADECRVLAERMGVISLQAGETLVDEDEDRRTLFVLTRGRLCVCKRVGEIEETVYQMRPGECAGTRAFIDGTRRRAALRAEEPVTVLTLEPEDFDTLVETHPRLVFKVMRAIFRITHSNLMRMNLESAEMRNYLLKTGGRY